MMAKIRLNRRGNKVNPLMEIASILLDVYDDTANCSPYIQLNFHLLRSEFALEAFKSIIIK